jgi:hypothetical protein
VTKTIIIIIIMIIIYVFLRLFAIDLLGLEYLCSLSLGPELPKPTRNKILLLPFFCFISPSPPTPLLLHPSTSYIIIRAGDVIVQLFDEDTLTTTKLVVTAVLTPGLLSLCILDGKTLKFASSFYLYEVLLQLKSRVSYGSNV